MIDTSFSIVDVEQNASFFAAVSDGTAQFKKLDVSLKIQNLFQTPFRGTPDGMEAVLNGGAADVIAGASGQSAGVVLGNVVSNRFFRASCGMAVCSLRSQYCAAFSNCSCVISSPVKNLSGTVIAHCGKKMLYLEKR